MKMFSLAALLQSNLLRFLVFNLKWIALGLALWWGVQQIQNVERAKQQLAEAHQTIVALREQQIRNETAAAQAQQAAQERAEKSLELEMKVQSYARSLAARGEELSETEQRHDETIAQYEKRLAEAARRPAASNHCLLSDDDAQRLQSIR